MIAFACRRRWVPTIAIGALACGLFPTVLSAQDARPSFRSSVAVVPITAVVRDSKNRIVQELHKDDFEVFEDSRRRQVVDFSATARGPVSLAVLFDTSGSMRGPNLSNGKAVVQRLLDHLDRTSDEAALFTFDQTTNQQTPFTNNPDRIRAALDITEGWGLTSIYDAIADTAKQLAPRQLQRRAVIVVTDGIDTSSTMTSEHVSRIASAIDVPVYVIAVGEPAPSRTETTAATDADLSNLAYWTGGDLRWVARSESAVAAVSALMAELRQQYFLAIESAVDDGWYRLDVRTRRKGLTVRARSGYFTTSPSRPESDAGRHQTGALGISGR
jgi:VWFA-related protein